MTSSEKEAIVALLCEELREIANEESPDRSSPALLQRWERQCGQLVSAMNMAGLTGLGAVCHWLQDNFHALVGSDESEDDSGVQDWAEKLVAYLESFLNDCLEANTALLDYLALPIWPLPLTESLRQKLEHELTRFDIDEKAADEQLPLASNPSMSSLAVPDDVRPELLEGLLLELPEQVRGFERAVEKPRNLGAAQRLAHTIKGAANVVGVSGLANLMHFTEELLEQATVHRRTLPAAFDSLLTEVADCLAASADYLCGYGPAPDNLASVLEQVLGTIREVGGMPARFASASSGSDGDITLSADSYTGPTIPGPFGVDEAAPTYQNRIQESASGEDSHSLSGTSASPALHEESSYRFHVSEARAQELLRIAGESQINNSQIGAQITALQASIQQSERYHRQIRSMAADLEALIQTSTALQNALATSEAGQLDPLEMERYSELHSFSHQLLELVTDSYEGVGHAADQLSVLSEVVYRQKQLNRANQDILLEMRLVSVATLLSRFERCVRQAARLSDKRVNLQVHGGEMLIDGKVLNRIAAPIMHLLRNAVDHGIEADTDSRLEAGKPECGLVSLSFEHRGESIVIRCEDDGQGLDYESIYRRAVDGGLVTAEESMGSNLLHQLILLPNFSTREQVSQTSGRGIGLDAVVTEVRQLNAQLSVSTEPGLGSCFEIVVPASILTVHALVVRCGESSYSLVTSSIQQIVYLDQNEALVEGGEFTLDQDPVPVLSLAGLLGFRAVDVADCTALLIVRRTDSSRIALAVEAIQASQDLVVKPLNESCYRPAGVLGATVLGDGTVSAVIDVQRLPGMDLAMPDLEKLRELQRSAVDSRGAHETRPTVLIVDDSLSVRRSLAQFVADLGMESQTARDGFEAIHAVGQQCPNLMLVDLEMPRMNGLELTAHLRANEVTRELPVIMITSRSTEKHRQLAKSAGVNGYLNKPWSDDELLSTIRDYVS